MHKEKKELRQIVLAAACGAMIGRAVILAIAPQYWLIGLVAGLTSGWICWDIKGFSRGIVKAWRYTIKETGTGQFWAYVFNGLLPGIFLASLVVDFALIINPNSIGFFAHPYLWCVIIPLIGGTILSTMLFMTSDYERMYCDATAKEFFADYGLRAWRDGFCQLAKDVWWLVKNFYRIFPAMRWGIGQIFLAIIEIGKQLATQIGRFLICVYLFTATHGRIISAIGASIGFTIGSMIQQPLPAMFISGLVGGATAGFLHIMCKLTLPLVHKPMTLKI